MQDKGLSQMQMNMRIKYSRFYQDKIREKENANTKELHE